MSAKDRDLDAAERALGTLSTRGEKPRAKRARQAWEQRLAALLMPLEDVAPPPGFFSRVTDRLRIHETAALLARSEQRTRRWKGIAALTGLIAAGLALFIALPVLTGKTAERYVAVVTADSDGSPGLIVQFDSGTGVATVVPVIGSAPEGKSWQMWHKPSGAGNPASIGLLPDDPQTRRDLRAGEGDVFAISVEDGGGSPSGEPTDARYHGTIKRID